MGMPSGTIRHRPIYVTQQVDPVAIRASSYQNTLQKPIHVTRAMPWHFSFCAGMALALVLLLCGRFI